MTKITHLYIAIIATATLLFAMAHLQPKPIAPTMPSQATTTDMAQVSVEISNCIPDTITADTVFNYDSYDDIAMRIAFVDQLPCNAAGFTWHNMIVIKSYADNSIQISTIAHEAYHWCSVNYRDKLDLSRPQYAEEQMAYCVGGVTNKIVQYNYIK